MSYDVVTMCISAFRDYRMNSVARIRRVLRSDRQAAVFYELDNNRPPGIYQSETSNTFKVVL